MDISFFKCYIYAKTPQGRNIHFFCMLKEATCKLQKSRLKKKKDYFIFPAQKRLYRRLLYSLGTFINYYSSGAYWGKRIRRFYLPTQQWPTLISSNIHVVNPDTSYKRPDAVLTIARVLLILDVRTFSALILWFVSQASGMGGQFAIRTDAQPPGWPGCAHILAGHERIRWHGTCVYLGFRLV